MGKQHFSMRIFWALAALLLAGIASAADSKEIGKAPAHASAAPPHDVRSGIAAAMQRPEGELIVYFLDVGQGDATLLAGPDFTILIDAGRHDRSDVVQHLLAAGVKSLDLLIGTHPHADHIGQIAAVLQAFPVSEVWMSGDQQTTRTFERTLDAILDSAAAYHEPRAGEIYDIGSVRVEVVNPVGLTGNLHEGCLAIRIVFGDVAFLFTGDAERPTELAMVARGGPLNAQVLQLGHHGSRTSSSAEFLQAVRPSVAVYSAGRDNPYGHPHREVLRRLAGRGVDVHGTAEHGTIRVMTDGVSYRVELERQETARGPPTQHGGAGCRPGQVDVNRASRHELERIVHIGERRSEEMIRRRPYASLDGLSKIRGIGPARLQDIKRQALACVDEALRMHNGNEGGH